MKLKSIKATDKDLCWAITVTDPDNDAEYSVKRSQLPKRVRDAYVAVVSDIARILKKETSNFGYVCFTLKEKDEEPAIDVAWRETQNSFYADVKIANLKIKREPDSFIEELLAKAEEKKEENDFQGARRYANLAEHHQWVNMLKDAIDTLTETIQDNWNSLAQKPLQLRIGFEVPETEAEASPFP